MPDRLDILAVRGYLSRDLLAITWRNGAVKVRLAQQERGNFHNPTPVGLVLQWVELDPVTFAITWDAVQRLMAVEDPPQPSNDDHGAFRQRSGSGSTSASYHLLNWRAGEAENWSALPALRHRRQIDGIGVLADLQMAAISRLLWELAPTAGRFPEDASSASPAWLELSRGMLPGCQGDGQSALPERSRLLSEDLTRLLGDLGDESDLARFASLETGLRQSIPPAAHQSTSPTYWEDCVRAEINRARMRISARLHWDSKAALSAIHANTHNSFIDNQQEAWLRSTFQARDPDGYRDALLADLRASDPLVVLESIDALFRHHPGQYREDLHRLLRHQEPDVIYAAAMAVMGKKADGYGWGRSPRLADVTDLAQSDTLVADALRALERLAGDPTVPIPPSRHWFNGSARTRALDVLMSCPPPWNWDAERCRQRLADQAECDGRMVVALLQRIGFPLISTAIKPSAPPSEEHKRVAIPLLRRCLESPPTRGTILAMQELTALGDADSRSRMREILVTLRAGCNAGLSHIDDPNARFPWTDTYDLDNIEREIGLKTP